MQLSVRSFTALAGSLACPERSEWVQDDKGWGRPSSSEAAGRARTLALPLLRYLLRGQGAQDTKLVALRVCQHDPARAALTDIHPLRSEPEQPLDLGRLVLRTEIQVQAVLDALPL